MRKILIAAMLIVAPAFAAENSAVKAEDAIKAVFAQLGTCTAKNDSPCFGELFADDATLISPIGNAKLIKGKVEIVKILRAMMSGPNMTDVKQKYTVQNVRVIGQDHAFFDCSVVFTGAKVPVSADGQPQTWHATGSMVFKGGKWLIEDIRSYAVEPDRPPTPAQPSTPRQPASAPPNVPTPPTPLAQPNAPAPPAAPPKT